MYKNILVATDFHNDCLPVVRQAAELSEQHQAKLSIVTVIPKLPYFMASNTRSVRDVELEFTTEAKARLEDINKELQCEADYYIESGTAKLKIIELAQQIEADLIVIGSHGRNGVQRLLGSTASGVLHRAKRDVLVVRIEKAKSKNKAKK